MYNRCALMPFRSITGRNYPPSSEFIFGPSTWLRSLIKPEPGRAIASQFRMSSSKILPV